MTGGIIFRFFTRLIITLTSGFTHSRSEKHKYICLFARLIVTLQRKIEKIIIAMKKIFFPILACMVWASCQQNGYYTDKNGVACIEFKEKLKGNVTIDLTQEWDSIEEFRFDALANIRTLPDSFGITIKGNGDQIVSVEKETFYTPVLHFERNSDKIVPHIFLYNRRQIERISLTFKDNTINYVKAHCPMGRNAEQFFKHLNKDDIWSALMTVPKMYAIVNYNNPDAVNSYFKEDWESEFQAWGILTSDYSHGDILNPEKASKYTVEPLTDRIVITYQGKSQNTNDGTYRKIFYCNGLI